MKRLFRYFLLATLAGIVASPALGQTSGGREMHKVKKKETIFGIARQYGLTVQQLIDANPEMNQPGYELKKDAFIVIPTVKSATTANGVAAATSAASRVSKKPIRLGVMLPLHDINGDGRRMVEYYRGVLMACDSLKKLGLSVDVHAWNTPDNEDIAPVLREKDARQCDIIIGPLYSKQMAQLSDFAIRNDIRLVIPFSINAPQVSTNPNIFQVYQSPAALNESIIAQFMNRFKDYHPVFIDCNDTTSQKGSFTTGLRRQLEARGIEYGITNLKSSDAMFARTFKHSKPNVVILNTGRSPELLAAFAKLNTMKATARDVQVSMFGYTEWMMYTKAQQDNFYKYDVYIPAYFHFNQLSSRTMRLQQKYRWNFHQDMMAAQPRFAITGFDHAMFFLQGFSAYGKNFTGAPGQSAYTPVQTPLRFERDGSGGLRNHQLLFVHYMPEQRMETIAF